MSQQTDTPATNNSPTTGQYIGASTLFVGFCALVITLAIVIGRWSAKSLNDAIEAGRASCESHSGYIYLRSRDFAQPVCVKVLEGWKP